MDIWDKIIEDMLKGSYYGGYVPRTNYYDNEEGVLYADKTKEVLDFEDCITITIELYGVRDEDLNIKKDDDKITIRYMENGKRQEPIPLNIPSNINKNTIKTSFNNFILDIIMEKMKE